MMTLIWFQWCFNGAQENAYHGRHDSFLVDEDALLAALVVFFAEPQGHREHFGQVSHAVGKCRAS